MKVHWTDAAVEQLRGIHAYIAQSSPQSAQRIVDRLTKRSQQIGLFPLSGRMVPEAEAGQSGKYWKVLAGSSITSSPIRLMCSQFYMEHNKLRGATDSWHRWLRYVDRKEDCSLGSPRM